jgi:hypothetical protein
MFKILIGFLLALRAAIFKIGDSVFQRLRNESGKIKHFQDPRNLKKVAIIAFIVIGIGVVAYKLLSGSENYIDGAKDFEQEIANKTGVKAKELEYDKNINDPLGDILGNTKTLNNEEEKLPSDVVDIEKPEISYCIKLLEKLKSNPNSLTLEDKVILKKCLEQNSGLTGSTENDALARLLINDPILSAEEQKILKELFGSEKACQEEMNSQIKTSEGNMFMNKMLDDENFNSTIVSLLRDPETLKQLTAVPQTLKSQFGFTDSEVEMFSKLLEKCSTDLLLKMLTDPKYKEIMRKLSRAAAADPNFVKNLTGDGLTDEEKDLIGKLMRNELESGSVDEAIARSLVGSDPMKKQQARDVMNARALGDMDLANALSKQLTNGELSDEEKSLLKGIDRDALARAARAKRSGDDKLADAYLSQSKGIPLTAEQKELLSNNEGLGLSTTDKEALAKAIAEDLAKRQAEIDSLKEGLSRAQQEAKEAAERLSKNQNLTPEQQAALQRFAELQRKLQEMEKLQAARKEQLAKTVTELQSSLDSIGATVTKTFPSGIEVIGFDYRKCSDIKPIKIIKKKVASNKKRAIKKDVFLGPDGSELTEDQVKILQALRKSELEKEKEFADTKNNIINPGSGFLSNSAPVRARVQGQGNGANGIQGLFLSDGGSLKPFKLSPDQLIPGLLLTEILVSDKGQGQLFRVKIVRDVYDPNGKLVIPKNTIAIGRTSSFDVDTAIMNLEATSVVVGGKAIELSLNVNSADLTSGLKGEVRDTRGKLLLGAFITSFTAGALGAISQNYIADFTQSDLIGDSMTGAAMQGAAEVAQRIAQLYAGDLQNAARIYHVPKGIKVILVPSGN